MSNQRKSHATEAVTRHFRAANWLHCSNWVRLVIRNPAEVTVKSYIYKLHPPLGGGYLRVAPRGTPAQLFRCGRGSDQSGGDLDGAFCFYDDALSLAPSILQKKQLLQRAIRGIRHRHLVTQQSRHGI
jgi:hypothetical protein